MSPPEREGRPGGNATRTAHQLAKAKAKSSFVSSQAVSWWSVHEFITPVLNQANSWPMAGTPAWCSLAHDDPEKWAALLDAAQHWALRVETCQEATCEASRDISAAADWSGIAQEPQRRHKAVADGVYIPRAVDR